LLHAQTKNLDYYLSTALSNSPLLKDYSNQILSYQLDSALIKAGRKPQVSAASQLLYAPYYKFFGYDTTISNGGNYTAQVTVTQPLLNTKTNLYNFQNYNLLNQSLVINAKLSQTDLKKICYSTIPDCFTDFTQVQFAQSLSKQLKDELGVVKSLVEGGVYLQIDYPQSICYSKITRHYY